nr:atherin-like [Aegilops tauschii subsp. strangulata]
MTRYKYTTDVKPWPHAKRTTATSFPFCLATARPRPARRRSLLGRRPATALRRHPAAIQPLLGRRAAPPHRVRLCFGRPSAPPRPRPPPLRPPQPGPAPSASSPAASASGPSAALLRPPPCSVRLRPAPHAAARRHTPPPARPPPKLAPR